MDLVDVADGDHAGVLAARMAIAGALRIGAAAAADADGRQCRLIAAATLAALLPLLGVGRRRTNDKGQRQCGAGEGRFLKEFASGRFHGMLD